ncbi:uncharacterized protein CMC5_067400 [Chondromyces crocatus]|uniref:Uncharacterized protein n=1 Tax=Chondromyces crocatus TaxID=52 RepID=A0A0K1ENW3_CHOCO|nr:uncharacterized protein CMC5_067400 [Chondromyces crocatus]
MAGTVEHGLAKPVTGSATLSATEGRGPGEGRGAVGTGLFVGASGSMRARCWLRVTGYWRRMLAIFFPLASSSISLSR